MLEVDKLLQEIKHEVVTELFIKPCDAFKLQTGIPKDIEMIRLAIIAELDAANLYERMAAESSMPEIARVFQSIANEEKAHVGELEFLMEKLDKSWDKHEDKGEDEAEELTGWEEDDEEDEDPADGIAPSESKNVFKGLLSN